jgi:hypothetical protein
MPVERAEFVLNRDHTALSRATQNLQGSRQLRRAVVTHAHLRNKASILEMGKVFALVFERQRWVQSVVLPEINVVNP